jgi:N-acyl-D-aspartate/D-glutamate deacylase
MLPDWAAVMNLPIPERIAKLRDRATRIHLEQRAASPDAGAFGRLTGWDRYVIGDTHSPANAGLKGRLVGDIARERGERPFFTLLDIVIEDELNTVLWPGPTDDDSESWRMRAEAWNDPNVMIGGSDAGAHLDRMCGAPYPTAFLADCLRGRQLISATRAIHLMTGVPARYFGLRRRGQLASGYHGDVLVFDPATIGNGDIVLRHDLPGGCGRLSADAIGVEHVFVNGRRTFASGQPTGDLPGTVLKSGRDTATVRPQ